MVGPFKRVELHPRAKFCQNRSNRGQDMAIFQIFKMAAAAILDFKNLKFLTAATVKWVELHQHAKFSENRLNRGRNMAIFRFFKMAAAAILDFRNYNRNRQFGRLIGNIISLYLQNNASCYLAVYVTMRPLVIVAYNRKGLGFESHRCR